MHCITASKCFQNWGGKLKRQNCLDCFLLLFVPRSSIFFKQAFKLHFNLMIQTIENMSMELLILVKRKEKANIKNKIKHLYICINHMRKTLHLLFSKKNYTKEKHRHIFQYFALVDVQDQLIQKITDKHNTIVLEDVLHSASGLKIWSIIWNTFCTITPTTLLGPIWNKIWMMVLTG